MQSMVPSDKLTQFRNLRQKEGDPGQAVLSTAASGHKCRREPVKESCSRNDIISYPGPEHLGSAARVCFLAARINSIGRATHLTPGAHNYRECALAKLYRRAHT